MTDKTQPVISAMGK